MCIYISVMQTGFEYREGWILRDAISYTNQCVVQYSDSGQEPLAAIRSALV